MQEATMMVKSESARAEIAKILASKIPPAEFFMAAEAAVRSTPKLNECTRESLWAAYVNCAEYGLLPNTHHGHAYLIPRYNGQKKAMECQFQVGYKGYIELCHRSEKVESVQADVVYANDRFEMVKGTEDRLVHEMARGNRGAMQGAWAMIRLTNGGQVIKYLDEEEINEARPSGHEKLFNTWGSKKRAVIAEMWIKTVLIRAMKLAPLTEDAARLVGSEQRENEMGLLPEAEPKHVVQLLPASRDSDAFPFDAPAVVPQLQHSTPARAPKAPKAAKASMLSEAEVYAAFLKIAREQGMTVDDFREEFDSEHPEKMGAYLQMHPDEIAAVLRGD